MEVFTIEAHEEVVVVRRVLMKSHEADEFKPCACLDENTRREDVMGKPLCISKKAGVKGREGVKGRDGVKGRHRVSGLHPFLQVGGDV